VEYSSGGSVVLIVMMLLGSSWLSTGR
jgi:hypothetical protein